MDLLCHHAKFGGALNVHAAGGGQKSSMSFCLSVTLLYNKVVNDTSPSTILALECLQLCTTFNFVSTLGGAKA